MSKFSDLVSDILQGVLDTSPEGTFLRLRMGQLGFEKGDPSGRRFSQDVADALGSEPKEFKLSRTNRQAELRSFSTESGAQTILVHATKDEVALDRDSLFADPGFAASLRDERSEPDSGLFNANLVVILDHVSDEFDTLRDASTDLTAPGGPLSPERVIRAISEASSSERFRTFVDATQNDLERMVVRGGPGQRGKVMEHLTVLASKESPQIGGTLQEIGDWISDEKFDDYLDTQSNTAIRRRLRKNETVASLISEAESGKQDPYQVLDDEVKPEAVDDWVRRVRDRDVELGRFLEDKADGGRGATRFDRFRYRSDSLLTSRDPAEQRKDRAIDGIHQQRNSLELKASYDEWPEVPPVKVIVNGETLDESSSLRYDHEAGVSVSIDAESKDIRVTVPPPSDEWVFTSITIHAGKKTTRSKPHSSVRLAVPPLGSPEFFLTDFEVSGENEALLINPARRILIGASSSSIAGAEKQEGVPEYFGPEEIVSTPARLMGGPETQEMWEFRIDGETLELPLIFEMEEAEEPGPEDSFLSAIHEASDTESPSSWAFESEYGAIRKQDGRQSIRLTGSVNDELQKELLIVEKGMLHPIEGADGAISNREPSAYVQGNEQFQVLLESYQALLAWLQENDTLPTLVAPDEEFIQLVTDILSNVRNTLESEPSLEVLRAVWGLGTLRSDDGILLATTPFWPPSLAYMLHLWEARQSGDLPEERKDSFTPEAFVPCSLRSSGGGLKPMVPRSGATGFWLEWSRADVIQEEELPSAARIVYTRLKEFARAFPQLVRHEPSAPLRLTFIGIRPDEDIVEGLEDFYEWLDRAGLDSIGLRVTFFLEKPGQQTELDARMAPDYLEATGEGGDPLHQNVRYSKQALDKLTGGGYSAPYSHISFLARGFERSTYQLDAGDQVTSACLDHLLPAPTVDLVALSKGGHDTVGFGWDQNNAGAGRTDSIRFADLWNRMQFALGMSASLGAPHVRDKYLGIRTSPRTYLHLRDLSNRSIWVVHLEPGVSLIPLVQSSQEHEASLIHFTDQQDPSTLGFDEVTLTLHKGAFQKAITRLLGSVDAPYRPGILEILNSINGRWTLGLLSGGRAERLSKLSSVAAVAHALSQARRNRPDLLWLAAGWEDFHRVTGKIGLPLDGILSSEGGGSDDILLAGLNPSQPEEVRLNIVEVKSGSSGRSIRKGQTQIRTTIRKIERHLNETTDLEARATLSELGKYLLRVAERMYVHNLLTVDDLEDFSQVQEVLFEGDYGLRFEGDGLPSYGSVIQVDHDRAERDIDKSDHEVWVQRIPWAELSQAAELTGRPSTEDPRSSESTDRKVPMESPVTGESEETQHQDTGIRSQEAEESEKMASPADAPSTSSDIERSDEEEQEYGEGEDVPLDRPMWHRRLLGQIDPPAWTPPNRDLDRFLLIDEDLSDLKVDVEPPVEEEIVNGPQATVIHLKPGAQTRVENLKRRLDSLKVKLGATGDLAVSTDERPGYITLFVPHEERDTIPLTAFLDQEELMDLELPIPGGITTENSTLWMDLVETNHLLVAGSTGSGKTVYLQGVLLTLASSLPPSLLKLKVVDPKELDLVFLEDLPHVEGRAIPSYSGCIDLLDELISLVNERKSKLRDSRARNLSAYNKKNPESPLPFVVTVIDEFNQLINRAQAEGRGDELEDKICQLAEIGRSFGVYIVLATQRPSAEVISGEIKANFPTRVSFRLPSHNDSQVILDEAGAEDLLPAGDALVAGIRESLIRMQAFYTDDEMVDDIVQAARKVWGNRPQDGGTDA